MLIQKYQDSWVNDFQHIKEAIEKNLPNVVINIEHIGSTSVRNLAAKPIIDIDLVYDQPRDFQDIKVGLEKLDYYHNGDQGIPGREVFKRAKQEKKHLILDTIKHHLYVCQANSEELHRHLIFRDALRTHEEERMAYEILKYEIAAKANQDRKVYAKLKEVMAREFVESVIRKFSKYHPPG